MNEKELAEVIESTDAALAIFRNHPGPFTAHEISLKSMLVAVRSQAAAQIERTNEICADERIDRATCAPRARQASGSCFADETPIDSRGRRCD